MKSLCVFCGSNAGHNPIYRAAAEKLGRLLAARQIELVYGAGNIGLMGAVADACLDAGADAYISKRTGSKDMYQTLRTLLLPDSSMDEEDVSSSRLSKRQKQLLIALDKGLSNRDIAEHLAISEHTVKVHLWRLFRRLGVKSRTQAVHAARTNGWLRG